jgi:lipopolysaccharide transport system ATP-binding protein
MSSSDIAIRVEGLGKKYLVPAKDGGGSIKGHLKQFLPFLRNSERDYFWALDDVSFEVKKGEILGILGKNGSGKSTLLKILSNVTFPTKGRAKMVGRVGSLLEVGTGFHPDLTGRENVFMAGALLGISRREIIGRFDQIVDFSGIERFIDVPVKRYSSGMYVRLAYSVASTLQSEILILDEVMAVGDQAFREKSQKNMGKIARDGRTILFVSHNIQAIRNLCQTGILLEGGRVTKAGTIEDASRHYMKQLHGVEENCSELSDDAAPLVILTKRAGWDGTRNKIALQWVETRNGGEKSVPTRKLNSGEEMVIRIGFELEHPIDLVYFTVFFINEYGDRIQTVCSLHDKLHLSVESHGVAECKVSGIVLAEGNYSLTLDVGKVVDGQYHCLDCVPNATQVSIRLGNYLGPVGLQPNQGNIAQKSHWEVSTG